MKSKFYYYLVNFNYENGDYKGDGVAMVTLEYKLDSFTTITMTQDSIRDELEYDKVIIKSFQQLDYGFVGDDEYGVKTYC